MVFYMLKKKIKYRNYSGVERERTLYFNLTKSEITKMALSVDGGLDTILTSIVESENMPELMKYFEKILLASYGEKSDDGERFMKGPDISKKFQESPVYDDFFMELITDEEKAAEFINAVMPEDLDEYIEKIKARQETSKNNSNQLPGA